MKHIKVLVVDDSALIREHLSDILADDDEIRVIGKAGNGKEAVEMVHELKPDLVTMDIKMPVMNGLEAIENIMAYNALPIIVVTGANDANMAFSAISMGALDVINKADINPEETGKFVSKVKVLSKVKVITHIRGRHGIKAPGHQKLKNREHGFKKVIAIASSTGGPRALSILLSELPPDFPCPVLIAQHIANGFVPGLKDWLNDICKINVQLGANDESIRGGTVYISPSDKHMKINNTGKIVLSQGQKQDIYVPSCNILLSSAADIYGVNCVGVILSGMGDDGVNGIRKIIEAGGITIAQDEKSSAIYGMPKVAIEKGYINRIISLDKIADELIQISRACDNNFSLSARSSIVNGQ
ncbi:MAG: chemotaxis-specific protein-glutamate methyltransferase CheB [Desulfobacterales bacterium]|nr:chemotaxis-specific protein-glutamate methyltransferase CheB [Desulfobacterales bacterium]